MPESSCFRIPDSMSYDQAAISEPLAIGVYAVRQSIPMKGAKVGILGFGLIGMSVLLPALAMGAACYFPIHATLCPKSTLTPALEQVTFIVH